MQKKHLIQKLRGFGFSEEILGAFEKVDRSGFVPLESKEQAYADVALSIGHGQTISQPYTIAFMIGLLEVNDNQKILEIGSGSGYVLALLSKLSPNGKIFGIERIKELAESSRKNLQKYKNIEVVHGQGEKGLKEKGKFDRILVSASCEDTPQNLLKQLKFKGILVAPVQNSIVAIKKESGENKVWEFPGFVFVPLISGG